MNGATSGQMFLLTLYFIIAALVFGIIGIRIGQDITTGNAILAHICQATPHCKS